MKLDWKCCFRVAVCAFILYLAIHYWPIVSTLLALLLGAISPLVLGGVLAYLINIPMIWYERHYFPASQNAFVQRSRRPLCMLAAIISLVLVVALICWLIIPELISCIQLLINKIPPAWEKLTAFLQEKGITTPEDLGITIDPNWKLETWLKEHFKTLTSGIGSAVGVLAGTLTSVFSGIVSAFLGVIFAIYMLLGKERLLSQGNRLLQSYLPASWHQKIAWVLQILNDCFHRYIVGQCTEAVILGALCTLGMLILGLPYATMIGALIAFTALIPIAGAYIGAGIGAFMILTVSPVQALVFLIFLVILQQLEGNLIFPKVVGSSIGLPAIWVLAAVTVGGSVMGVLGMLLAVPISAAIYRIVRHDVLRREGEQDQPCQP